MKLYTATAQNVPDKAVLNKLDEQKKLIISLGTMTLDNRLAQEEIAKDIKSLLPKPKIKHKKQILYATRNTY